MALTIRSNVSITRFHRRFPSNISIDHFCRSFPSNIPLCDWVWLQPSMAPQVINLPLGSFHRKSPLNVPSNIPSNIGFNRYGYNSDPPGTGHGLNHRSTVTVSDLIGLMDGTFSYQGCDCAPAWAGSVSGRCIYARTHETCAH